MGPWRCVVSLENNMYCGNWVSGRSWKETAWRICGLITEGVFIFFCKQGGPIQSFKLGNSQLFS